jgi:hypothetical protein
VAFAAPDNFLQDFTVSQCTTAQYTAADIRLTDSRTVHPNCIIRIRYSVAWFVSWRYGPVCAVRKRKKICIMIWKMGLKTTVPSSWFSLVRPGNYQHNLGRGLV